MAILDRLVHFTAGDATRHRDVPWYPASLPESGWRPSGVRESGVPLGQPPGAGTGQVCGLLLPAACPGPWSADAACRELGSG